MIDEHLYKTLKKSSVIVPKDHAVLVKKATETFENSRKNEVDKRSSETHFNHCLSGGAIEVGIAEILGGTVNTQPFDVKNRESYAWDVKAFWHRIETKQVSSKGYLSLDDRRYEILRRNSPYFGYLIGAKIKILNDSFLITPHFIAKSPLCMSYFRRSEFNHGVWIGGEPRKSRYDDCLKFLN